MDVACLERQIERDLQAGPRPFLVIASAGTINTGAVDPIREIVEVAHRHGLWVHVDGAYGAFFVLTSQGRQRPRRDGRPPTRSRSTRTRACSSPPEPVASSYATAATSPGTHAADAAYLDQLG